MDNNKDKKTDDILEKLVHINRITKLLKVDEDLAFLLWLLLETKQEKLV